MSKNNHTLMGSEPKFKFEITGSGFSMHDDDFSVVLRQGSTEVEYKKSDFIEQSELIDGEEKYSYYLIVDSSLFGVGGVDCIVTAHVPDTDSGKGYRVEKDKFTLMISERA